MKVLTLTTTLLAALSLSSFAGSHTVKAGDTVHSISRKHKVSVSNIMKWNKISDPTKLRIGQSLTVSHSSPKASTPSKSSKYRVSKGDTFYSIARRHKLSVAQLRALNPSIRTHLIAPGQSLMVTGKPAQAMKKVEKKPVVIAKVIKKAAKTPAKTPAKTSTPTKEPIAPKQLAEPEPKEISTAITLAQNTTRPAPKEETVAVVSPKENEPVSTPPAPPVVEEQNTIQKTSSSHSSVASIILTDETTFDAFAGKHGTNTSQLNALNGWNLPKATVLARGSEIYVPQ